MDSVTQVRRTAQQVLQDRLPDAVTSAAALLALPTTAPKTWRRLPDFTLITEQQSPAVVVTVPLMQVIGRDPDGTYRVRWTVKAFAVVRGRDWDETTDRTGLYATAMRWALEAEPDLRGLSDSMTLVREDYAELAGDDKRTVGACSVTATYDGSLSPLAPVNDPTVQAAAVTVDLLDHPAL